ncbi:uncharacterized protein RAG0_08296 [Rhynchosporium agropyri]|uniref:Uncharacterized protein n=1 Tax=Rhynchosporium agropyri TaxID=914238 RepID=A0A1E1KT72_9HELO|nr:uncharacterized protein RAG0_08296 [Rhynchosporium agropyri]
MSHDEEANENSRLLDPRIAELRGGKQRTPIHDEASSIVSSHVPKEEQELAGTAIGERLPYNDYTTIDKLHDLKSLKGRLLRLWDSCQEWIAASMIGILTAVVAFFVDIAIATISEHKVGYCSSNVLQGREACCMGNLLPDSISKVDEFCSEWKMWAENYWTSFGIYAGFALLCGIIAGGVIMTTRANLPAVRRDDEDLQRGPEAWGTPYSWLVHGTIVKLVLAIVTFGCKVPLGIIIPALDAGALFGRLIGQIILNDSSGMFAMVGAAAFLAGVSRMTVSLAVIMFELTGEVDYIPPFMIAIMVASWVADAISR